MTTYEQINAAKAFHDIATKGLVIIDEGKRVMKGALVGLLSLQPNKEICTDGMHLDATLAWNACNPDGYEDGDEIQIKKVTLGEEEDILVHFSYQSKTNGCRKESYISISLVSGLDCHDIIDAYLESMQGNEMRVEEIEKDTVELSNGTAIPARMVYISENGYNVYVYVACESDYNKYIEEGSKDDELFYAYVPDHEFNTLTDDELIAWLDKYIN